MAKKGTFIIGIILILALVAGLYQYQAVQDQKDVTACEETAEQRREGTIGGFDDETELIRDLFYQVQQDDLDLAQRVIDSDDEVDDLFNKVKNELIDLIYAKDIDAKVALDLLMTAKYYERIGDHAVNIAEWVVYSITGVHKSNE